MNKMMDLPVFIMHPGDRVAGRVKDSQLLEECLVLEQARFVPIMFVISFGWFCRVRREPGIPTPIE